MNFAESVKYVETQTRQSREKVDLSIITELLHRVGNPQDSFKIIHIAGTNGKGSVCAYIECALREQGYKTGLFTSPYIEVFNERIKISGSNVEDETFSLAATKVKKIAEEMTAEGYYAPSFFELLTTIAFLVFKEQNIDIAVVEVGIGGTYDSTNIVQPILSVITPIAYDHMNILGDTIDAIAENKAGIIKQNCPVVAANQEYDEAYAVLLNAAKEKNAPFFSLGKSKILIDSIGFAGAKFSFRYDSIVSDVETSLLGYHQVQNAACAFLSLCVLSQYTKVKLSPQSILKGIKNAKWPGRMELVSESPFIILDGAHNEHAMQALVNTMKDFIPIGKITAIFGVMKRKNYISMAKSLSKAADIIYTVTIDDDQSVEGNELAQELQDLNINAQCVGGLEATINELIKQENGLLLICGSLHLAGKASRIFKMLKKHNILH